MVSVRSSEPHARTVLDYRPRRDLWSRANVRRLVVMLTTGALLVAVAAAVWSTLPYLRHRLAVAQAAAAAVRTEPGSYSTQDPIRLGTFDAAAVVAELERSGTARVDSLVRLPVHRPAFVFVRENSMSLFLADFSCSDLRCGGGEANCPDVTNVGTPFNDLDHADRYFEPHDATLDGYFITLVDAREADDGRLEIRWKQRDDTAGRRVQSFFMSRDRLARD